MMHTRIFDFVGAALQPGLQRKYSSEAAINFFVPS
jgi:hypothetical protein